MQCSLYFYNGNTWQCVSLSGDFKAVYFDSVEAASFIACLLADNNIYQSHKAYWYIAADGVYTCDGKNGIQRYGSGTVMKFNNKEYVRLQGMAKKYNYIPCFEKDTYVLVELPYHGVYEA